MLNTLITYITEKKIFTPQDNVLLTISGGVDSVVLLHLLSQCPQTYQQIALAHCNFQLRGNESNQDEAFVKALAQQYDIPCFVTRFDTYTLADTQKGSIQMIARQLRYEWFEELRQSEGYDYIATAHHQSDLTETILLNLVRGTGIAGLHGIKEKNGKVIRPLLFASKNEIENFATQEQLQWREDASNKENKYYRNRLRNEVIPVLKGMNPNLETTLAQSVEKISAVERFFEEAIKRVENLYLREENGVYFLNFELFKTADEPLIVLFEILKKFGFSYTQAKEVLASINQISGKQFFSPTFSLVKDRTQLVIAPKTQAIREQTLIDTLAFGDTHIGSGLSLERKAVTVNFKIPRDPSIACLDWEKLTLPLKIRPWQQGDWFKPLGMTQRKKLSDFLIDQKVPLNLKERIQVVVSGDAIVWVVGYRIDNRFKISDQTKEVLVISV